MTCRTSLLYALSFESISSNLKVHWNAAKACDVHVITNLLYKRYACWLRSKQKQLHGDVLWKECSYNFCKITWKLLCRSFFQIKFQASDQRKTLQHRRFSVNFEKLLRTPFITEHLRGSYWVKIPTFWNL